MDPTATVTGDGLAAQIGAQYPALAGYLVIAGAVLSFVGFVCANLRDSGLVDPQSKAGKVLDFGARLGAFAFSFFGKKP